MFANIILHRVLFNRESFTESEAKLGIVVNPNIMMKAHSCDR
jgi:hypothetical protein